MGLISSTGLWCFDWADSPHLQRLAKVAPLGTAIIALAAAMFAFYSLSTQVRVARKRAAIDFFLKTEMDPAMRLAYQKYKDALEASKKSPSIEQFKQSEPDKYWEIRTYLDINELICIGVNEKVFHQRVCYGFWYNILRFSVTDGREVIEHARGQEGDERTYDEILNVSTRWLGTRRPWQLWRSRRSREKNAAR
jgi:hypothetical protein